MADCTGRLRRALRCENGLGEDMRVPVPRVPAHLARPGRRHVVAGPAFLRHAVANPASSDGASPAGTARNGRKEWTAWADPPTVLVLAPTRELAAQIHDEANKFGRPLKIRSHVVFGGAPKSSQIRGLENG